MISFDQMGPISRKPIQGDGWAERKRPKRLRATYNRQHGIRCIFGALDVHRDRLYARMRPRRAGRDALVFVRMMGPGLLGPAADLLDPGQPLGHLEPRHPRLRCQQHDRVGPHSDLHQLPQPGGSGLECPRGPHRLPDWHSAQRAVAGDITHRNGADRDRRIAAPERKHRVAA